MPVEIKITGMKEWQARLRKYPRVTTKVLRKTLEAALLVLQGNVPKYPSAPRGSTYVRTGTLGRSLGAGMGGSTTGKADIYTVKRLGSGGLSAEFGTNLSYAPFVIGATRQSRVHKRNNWWTIKTIKRKSTKRIGELFKRAGEQLAEFLRGRSVL